ncbi:MAG: hypothetical protein CVV14_14760 [Gammaproteobacteria bacterium HGW-Gammaproteobacteria-4]|jgi:hypothetical protein|nr:MAG: hypothetical protein CVV14_14760 [Gammaproteobacteria bacterium HGW-Gammaproteobacteria-4]PKM09990.1 MAG: hypothetical protein CVV15_07295 [Gammaproteobacteria bacterium HGW-Gammaproteobacteria-5]
MSTFNRNTLAAALAVSLASLVSAPASASVKVAQSATVESHLFAAELLGGAGTNPNVTLEGVVDFSVTAPDILIGRVDTDGNVTVIVTLTGAEIAPGFAVADITPAAGFGAVSGFTVGTTSFQFTVTPPVTGIVAGSLFSINANALDLTKAVGLRPGGAGVTADLQVINTATNSPLATAPAKVILAAANATETTISDTTSLTVDVAAAIAKKQFVTPSPGTGNQKWAELGTVTFAQADVDGTTLALEVASSTTNPLTSNSAAGNFVFDTAADTAALTLTVPNAAAFTKSNATGTANAGFWAQQAACAVATTIPANGATVQNFVVSGSDPTKFTATVAIDTATGRTYHICGLVNGATAIANQTIGLTAKIDIANSTIGVDPAAVSGDLADIGFNGTVVNVATFNPAGNTTQQSFLRVSNPGSNSGLVTIEGVDDAGVAAPGGDITFTLNPGESVQLDSTVVENGGVTGSGKAITGALGNGTGKWRLVVTGELGEMNVSSLNRNNTTGTVTNLTDFDN